MSDQTSTLMRGGVSCRKGVETLMPYCDPLRTRLSSPIQQALGRFTSQTPTSYQFHEFIPDILTIYVQPHQGNRQLETSWSGTSRVEMENPLARFTFRFMRVTTDNDAATHGGRTEVQFLMTVMDVEANPAYLDLLAPG